MKRLNISCAALCALTLIPVSSARAQNNQPTPTAAASIIQADTSLKIDQASDASAGDTAVEVESLKRRVEELENQNRALALTLIEIKAKLGAMARPESAAAVPAPVAPGRDSATASPPAPSAAQSSTTLAAQPSTLPAAQSSTAAAPNDTVRWSEILGEGNRIKLYGFLRLDLDFDSQHPNNTQIPFFITSPDARLGGTGNGDFSMHPRLTRFGLDYTGPRVALLADARLTGKFEADFENGGTESRQIIRIRHAYFRLGWKDFSLLGGQTWDVVSPLFPVVNHDSLMWNAGNVGDRRPQLRATYEPKAGRGKFSLAGAAGLTGAIDAQDLDANGFRDGEESALPNFQGRVGYSYPLGKGRDASLGVSGFYGFLKTARPVAGRTEFRSQLVNLDFILPLHHLLTFRGEG
ncbi:MAG TPA: hypothetical protein VF703_08660 [Pyrinomonadaceae bacterium]|jgi:hypothetical protein